MKKFYKQFTSQVEMITAVTGLTPRLDTQAMLDFKGSPRRLYIVTTEGKVHVCDTFKKFLSLVNYLGDLEFMHPICNGRGGSLFNIFSKKDYFGTEGEPFVPVVEEVEEVDMGDLLSLDVEQPVVNPTVAEDKVITTETKEVDWDMIEALENKKYDKIKLDEYAEKEFGIKLNQRNTLSNMIKDFKDQLATK